jgi:hypothetical protein
VRFVVDKVALEQVFFFEYLSFSPANDISTIAPYSFITAV